MQNYKSGSMPRQGSHTFAQVPQANIPRSSFRRPTNLKTTFDAADLVPIYVDEVLPGDTHRLNMTTFARLATPVKPVMDNMYMDFFFFFVPNRLLWDNWQRFMGEQDNPGDSTDFLVPTVNTPVGGWTQGSVSDYFGIPTLVENLSVNALHHRAYNLIYNEWFRDQNLIDSVPVNKGDGPDAPEDYVLLKRGKRHDYFTSCLPWPQKGPGVELPLGETAPVVTNNQNIQLSTATYTDGFLQSGISGGGVTTYGAINASYQNPTRFGIQSGLEADLSSATAATINSLRLAFQTQKLLERDARGGTRYTEIIRSHFGVISPDARQQRPEYLGGGSTRVNTHPIPQTNSTDATTPQGNLAAMGTQSASNIGFTKSFVEHGVIIGLVSVRADLTYQQGLNKMFSRQTKYDYFFPVLSNLGEQAVLNQEIYAQGSSKDSEVFGYQERWAEYRYHPSKITGKFRSNDPQSLDVWHLAQDFSALPTLSEVFIEENPPVDRVIAVADEPHFLFDANFDVTSARPMPLYSVPGLIDHF